MKRGEVYDARLSPTVGSEQAGSRPAIVISNDTINDTSPVVLAIPCTRYTGQRVYRSQVVLRAHYGGLDVDSVAMADQMRAIATHRLGRLLGALPSEALRQVGRALLTALDLP